MAKFDPEKNNNKNESEKDLVMYENKIGLSDDMKRLGMSSFFCDVKFLVGKSREPIYGVKAVLASRSRVFCKILYEKHFKEQSIKHQTKVDKKLRYFLKRYSEPILQASELDSTCHSLSNDVFLIEEFEPDEFQQIIEYIHCGSVTLQPRTLLGIMNAADYYGLEELKKLCMGFVKQCVNLDTVCTLLASADRFFHYKSTRYLLQKVFEFVDEKGYEVLNLGAFTILPQHVVRLILSRKGLKADELTKFQASLMWAKKHCDSHPEKLLRNVMCGFIECIKFKKIAPIVLIKDIYPLRVVPYPVIMNALAFQADPTLKEIRTPHSRVRSLSAGGIPLQLHTESSMSSREFGGSTSTLTSSSNYAGSSSETDCGISRRLRHSGTDSNLSIASSRRSSIQ